MSDPYELDADGPDGLPGCLEVGLESVERGSSTSNATAKAGVFVSRSFGRFC